jgi:protein-S-isoprenylcysteine O-methyltransferase Ste14
MADETTDVVITGPYRRVRHPIYLGLSMGSMGQALAFASWSAFVAVLVGMVPTCAWRAFAEEKLLTAALGDRYAVYRKQTKMTATREHRHRFSNSLRVR